MVELLTRRSLLGEGNDGYISDGLVFRLDGIKKGTTDPAKWVDLVGGMVFTEAGGTSVHEDGCIHVTTTQRLVGDFMPDWPYTTHTIEIATDINWKAIGWHFLFKMKRGNVSLWGQGSKLLCGHDSSGTFGVKNLSNAKLFSYAYDNIIVDGSSVGIFEKSYNIASALPIINSNDLYSQSYAINFKLHSVRVYNRLLATDEMINNQRVDNERFNLGISI